MHAARMLSLLHDVEIDWGWSELSEDERTIARRHEALLQADRKAHTVESAEAALLAAARELPDKLIRARAIDDEHTYIWQVVEGDVYPGEDFDESGMCPEELTPDDFLSAGVTIVRTAIVFPDSLLAAIEARGWVAQSSLSTLVQSAWQLAAHDLPAGFRPPGGPRHVQSIFLPVSVWGQIKLRSRIEDRSMSYLVQRAVTAAYELPVE
jgi:hypothetical protein